VPRARTTARRANPRGLAVSFGAMALSLVTLLRRGRR
jgi:hypothetical protein